jgi:hypothetical protein
MPEEARDIEKIFSERRLIEKALRKGAFEALRVHKEAGLPLAVWRDGRVQWVSPEEFERGLMRSSVV